MIFIVLLSLVLPNSIHCFNFINHHLCQEFDPLDGSYESLPFVKKKGEGLQSGVLGVVGAALFIVGEMTGKNYQTGDWAVSLISSTGTGYFTLK